MADTMVNLKKMKVNELKQALKDRGLAVSGTKPELIKRLGEAIGTTVDDGPDDGLEDSLQGIDDILNDDPVPIAVKKTPTPVSTTKSAAPVKAPIQAPNKPDAVSSNGAAEKTEPDTASAVDSTHLGKPAEVAKLSDAERLKMRAEKFGAVSADSKKQQRAERFGLPVTTSSMVGKTTTPKVSGEELERLKKRTERFGAVVSTSLAKVDEEEKKRKRAERFGTTIAPAPKTKISVNSIDPEVEAKKRKRAERFGLT